VVLLLYIGWVYGHQPMITFLPSICRRVLPGVPCVTQFENVDRHGPARSLLGRALRKAAALVAGPAGVHPVLGTLLRDSARIVALSGPHRARLTREDPAIDDRVVIVPPPPLIRFCADDPAAARQRARDTIGAAADDFLVVYWGYIYPGKGVETLFEAFRLISGRNPTMRLVIVGGALEVPTPSTAGAYYRMVRALPEKLGIVERVTWTGHFDWDSDAGSLYLHAADLCVLPFDYGVTLNNSSLAAASTHAVPVIVTELSDGRDEALEHGRNVYLCRPRDPRTLAEALELLGSTADLRERLRAGSRRLARDWHSWETTTRRLVSILESARSRPDGRSPRPHRASDRSLPASGWSEAARDEDGRPEPLVSVIVAAHNVERYLSQCLDSLVSQTLRNIEIIVVDDASQDRGAEILEAYRSRHPDLVRVVTCERNKGLASVRNIGMKLARGRYLAFTDADDWADVRMCERLYQRAQEHDADVVIADATVFYDDTKTFAPFFDRHIRQTLDPALGAAAFELSRDHRVMLLELVAWTKLYRRAFLEKHALQFEDGMNSYEDICFHFSVLLKASRISLLDTPLFFYRQNRPGQISARTDRRIDEVFAVFDRIRRNLAAWDASVDVWALLVAVQVRQFDWLLKDRVRPAHRREFLAAASRQLHDLPGDAIRRFGEYARPGDVPKLFCLRRRWLYGYDRVARGRGAWGPVLDAVLRKRGPARLARAAYRASGRRARALMKRVAARALETARLRERLDAMDARLARLEEAALPSDEALVEIHRVHGRELRLCRPPRATLSDVVRRVESDYYLLQAASFREGDTVVDVGAHVGALSIYLAQQYPFVRIVALEPEPSLFRCLLRNIELSGVMNVTAINRAVSGDGRRATLYTSPWPGTFATIDPRLAAAHPVLRPVPVETLTLAQLFRDHDIRRCRVLKISAPGAVRESLSVLRTGRCVDLLCGEVDVRDCGSVDIEAASWRVARQHFWRIEAQQGKRTVRSWLHDAPTWPEDELVTPHT
jgi:FkbM family methyltransferase